MWRYLLLLEVCLFGVISVGHAAESSLMKKGGDSPAVPTTIDSKKMTVRNQENQAVFEGMVVLTRGTLIVYSDKMVVLFNAPANDGAQAGAGGQAKTASKGSEGMPAVSSRSISRIEATGHVKIENDNSNATCEKAVYFTEEEKIIMTGEPVAWEKGTRVSGKQITIYLAEERSVVEGNTHVRIEGDNK
jgi:lipopolysaccharide export system protein LptA